MTFQKPITPHILHKDSPDDVLLQDVRELIPARIERDAMDAVVENWNNAEKQRFCELYRPEGALYVLRSVPASIDLISAASLAEFEVNLLEFYTQDDGAMRLTAQYLPSGVEEYLRRAFLPHVAQVTREESEALAIGLAKSECWKRARVSCYLMLNDTDNYFFYRKAHEHVPGLMLIEVARQAMYHYVYNSSGYDRGEISISMSTLDVQFISYVESTYAVEALVTQTEGLARKTPRFVDKTASFFQNGRSVAKIRLQGGAMKMPLFKRMRTLNFPETHWFTPSNRVLRRALVNTDGRLSIRVDLEMLSMRAVSVKGQIETDGHCEVKSVSIYADGFGFLCLPVDSYSVAGDRTILHLDTLSREQSNALKDVIKSHFFFVTRDDFASHSTLSEAEISSSRNDSAMSRYEVIS
ncbi:AfsA-related hotdog domain-containing protein [Methylosinus sp. Ce-a6]|uniref:AfsA-related hotdog domain-containing protein n=1 Tax=Methylosinus sp. Ce-a6 TaxID=2172005 RepID=UPI00135CD64A|nr:AfsA-related hotdog domain-containing protein [Methylosinus sp. Ce-a6]